MQDAIKNSKQSDITPQRESVSLPVPDRAALARLLDEWIHDDETEHQETFAALRRCLDEDRPDGYKLFS